MSCCSTICSNSIDLENFTQIKKLKDLPNFDKGYIGHLFKRHLLKRNNYYMAISIEICSFVYIIILYLIWSKRLRFPPKINKTDVTKEKGKNYMKLGAKTKK